MTFRTLRRTLLVACGVGVLTSAGQLGLGYGLGILRFGRAFDAAIANHWPAQQAWVAWFAMIAAMTGAAVAYRTSPAAGPRTGPTSTATGIGVRVANATAAALGGAVVAPLSMVPAQAARVPGVEPVLVTGISAALGAAVGLVAALAVSGPRPIRWNLAAIASAVWLLALASVVPSLGPTDPMPAVRLGVFDPAGLPTGAGQRLALVAMPALALVVGAVTGGLARWREYPLPVVAACGVAGPAMLSLTYLIAGAGSGADRYQAVPYWAALVAVATGLLGSVLAAIIRWPILPRTTPAADRAEGAIPPSADADADANADDDTSSPDVPGPAGGAGPGKQVEPTENGQAVRPAVAAPTTAGPDTTVAPATTVARGTSASVGTLHHHPTTEDFWPSTPSPAKRAGRASEARRDRPGPPAERERDGEPAATPSTGATDPDPAGTGGAGTTPVSARATGADPAGVAEAGVAEAGVAEAGVAEAGVAEAPANRSGRSWRRLFRRSDPAGATTGPEPDAGNDNSGATAGAANIGAENAGAENDAGAEPATGNRTAEEPRGDETAATVPRQRGRRGRTRAEPEVPAGDTEYVDWVSGLRPRNPRRDDPTRAGGSATGRPSSRGRPADR